MKRIIKFRAFVDGIMYYNVELTLDGWVHWWGDDGNDTECKAIGTIYEDRILRTCELMQFTGLLDRNGKETYENDIIKYHDYDESFGKVKYDKWKIGQIIWDNEHLRYQSETGNKYGKWLENFYRMNYIEVIGNIYENPELLT